MTQTIYSVGTWSELFALPRFRTEQIDRATVVTGTIVGDYEMPQGEGQRNCGISHCPATHRHGYIVRLPDSTLTYLGRDCGKTNFGVEWSRKRSEYRAAKTARSRALAVERLRSELQEWVATGPRVPLQVLARARLLLGAFDALPDLLRQALVSRAQSNDSDILAWRMQTHEEAKQEAFRRNSEKIVPRRITYATARLSGLSALRRENRVDYLIDNALPQLRSETERLLGGDARDTDKLVSTLRRWEGLSSRLSGSIGQLDVFFSESNLRSVGQLPSVRQLGHSGIAFDLDASALVLT